MTPSPTWHAEMKDKLYGMVLRQLRYHEDRLDPMRVLDNPLGIALLRRASDMMALWGACENKACRRSRECRRKPNDCVARYAPLLPPEARAGVIARLRDPCHE